MSAMANSHNVHDVHRLRGSQYASATICDGRGGSLLLDLSNQEVHWLADACNRLIGDDTPPAASMLKVRAAGETYMLTRHVGADHEVEVRLTNLFDPGEHITLTSDLVRIITSLIEHAVGGPTHVAQPSSTLDS